MFNLIKSGKIVTWQQVHEFYDQCQKNYIEDKARYALYILELLYSIPIKEFTPEVYSDITKDVAVVSMHMLESSISSREKDFKDFFRSITFKNKEEKDAVLGTLEDNSFLKTLKATTDDFNAVLGKLFQNLR